MNSWSGAISPCNACPPVARAPARGREARAPAGAAGEGDPREVAVQLGQHAVRDALLDGVPVALGQGVGLGVDVHGRDVLALGRQRRVVDGGKQISMCAPVAGMPARACACCRSRTSSVGQLEDPVMVGLRTAPTDPPRGQPVEGQVELDAGAVRADVADRPQEVVRQVGGVAEGLERVLRVGVGQHHVAAQRGYRRRAARRSPDPVAGSAREDPVHADTGPDLGARFASRLRHGLGDPAHPAAHEAPASQPSSGVVGHVVVHSTYAVPSVLGRRGCR